MSSVPLVSVVIPSYNHRPFIFQALASVIEQTYPRIEIIVIDDGSTDGSVELIRRIADTYRSERPFVVKCHANKGAAATINEGVELASGSYLAILNSDDFYSTDRIDLMVRSACETGAEFIYSELELIDEFGRAFTSDWYSGGLEMSRGYPTSSFCFLERNLVMSTGNFFFSRNLYQKVGPFSDLITCHDWDFLLRSLVHTEPLFLRRKTFFYRFHGSNTINKAADLLADESLRVKFTYLSQVSGKRPPNRLAPCFANWGHYWTEFVAKRLPDLAARPEFKPILF